MNTNETIKTIRATLAKYKDSPVDVTFNTITIFVLENKVNLSFKMARKGCECNDCKNRQVIVANIPVDEINSDNVIQLIDKMIIESIELVQSFSN
jgi:hypothetical protein